jgi:hypothetical protein
MYTLELGTTENYIDSDNHETPLQTTKVITKADKNINLE